MTGDGVDFCVYAKRATGIDLLLFDGVDDIVPDAGHRTSTRRTDRTGDYWHVHVRGIGPASSTASRADGPWAPDDGLRFDATRCCSTRTAGRSRRRPATAGSRPGDPADDSDRR